MEIVNWLASWLSYLWESMGVVLCLVPLALILIFFILRMRRSSGVRQAASSLPDLSGQVEGEGQLRSPVEANSSATSHINAYIQMDDPHGGKSVKKVLDADGEMQKALATALAVNKGASASEALQTVFRKIEEMVEDGQMSPEDGNKAKKLLLVKFGQGILEVDLSAMLGLGEIPGIGDIPPSMPDSSDKTGRVSAEIFRVV